MAKKKKENELPETIFVARADDGDGGTYLISSEEAMECIDDDGPTLVGTYELMDMKKLARVVQEVE